MTETPKYSVIKKEKDIELRRYPPYITAEVTVPESNYRKAVFKGFNILANYIFGNNIKSENIEMTAPVAVSQSEKIAMTKPVTVSGDENYTVAFIMPSEYTLKSLPEPKDPSIRFNSIESHTMAVTEYSGYFGERKIIKAKSELTEWLEKEGIEIQGEFIVAGYNPPWVPGFLARNEVMVRVKA